MAIGNDILPGIVTNVESLPAVSVGGLSAANVLVVGGGDLTNAEAEPNQPYTVTRGSQVSNFFGTENPVSRGVTDALNEDALPVYAVVTDENEYTETIDASTGTLPNVPTVEDPERITCPDYDVEIVHGSPSEDDATVLEVNPTTGDYAVGETPATDVTYEAYDYASALTTVENEAPDEIDYVYVLSENTNVVQDLNDTVNALEGLKNFVIGGIGISSLVDDVSTLSAPVDNSRMQIFYPSRGENGHSTLGAKGGKKASMGINGSTMNKRLSTHTRMIDRLSEADQMDLVGESIIPVASESRGALLVDDPTCIAEDNSEEENMADGYSRLVVDRVTEIVHDTERPYIGKLNKPSARGSLQASLRTGIGFLEAQDAIVDYDVRVFSIDSMSAQVDLQVETTKPLRNIYNDIAVGGN